MEYVDPQYQNGSPEEELPPPSPIWREQPEEQPDDDWGLGAAPQARNNNHHNSSHCNNSSSSHLNCLYVPTTRRICHAVIRGSEDSTATKINCEPKLAGLLINCTPKL
ncbi:hypothetical protein OUZ56_012364 [Daphnia magna]|uniref:Uncharacterized protein n=1 Tax=Daphnia magna TaxID=35525 RepID=A0ABQ9Z2S4_9CRUS|nr:hypothetical protein OUZ56_012364 [Daphnia magna]